LEGEKMEREKIGKNGEKVGRNSTFQSIFSATYVLN